MDFQGALAFLLALGSLAKHIATPIFQSIAFPRRLLGALRAPEKNNKISRRALPLAVVRGGATTQLLGVWILKAGHSLRTVGCRH